MRTLNPATSIFALLATTALSMSSANAQAVPNTTTSSDNVLNLLSPFLNLNATAVGQQTLTTNLSQAIATNNNANAAFQALSVSDANLLGARSNTITLANGTTATYGIAANLAGGLPAQATVNPTPGAATTTPTIPIQSVGGLGVVLGAAYQMGVAPIGAGAATTAILANTATLLNTAYNSFTSSDLGVAKNYFANGAATNPGTTPANYVPVPAVAAPGSTLPTANGLPNATNSVYDISAGVTNKQAGQDTYGDSRPVQIAPMATATAPGINQFDSAALSGLATNPSFPSGHTNYAFTESVLIGMLVPQDYQNMLARASAYGNSRIVLGVHYPLDIIASRAFSAYDLAQAFTNPAYQNGTATTVQGAATNSFNLATLYNAAKPEIQTYLTTRGAAAGCGATIAACSTSAVNTANDPYVPSAATAAAYVANLTYGLPTLTLAQAPQEAAAAGGPDASILLAPLYGGNTAAAKVIAPSAQAGTANGGGLNASLTTNTISQIIQNTENNALAAFYGTSLSYWTRINLYAAAGYFGNLTGTLTLDPTDIVTTNTSIASGGQLNANGAVIGTTTVTAGATFAPGGTTPVGSAATVNGSLTFAAGSNYNVRLTPTANDTTNVTGTANLNGTVNLSLAPGRYQPTTQYTILTDQTAGGITGNFASVTTNLAFFAGSVSIVGDPTAVLTLTALPFNAVAQTGNQNNVGAGLTVANQFPVSAVGANIIGNLQTIATAAQGRAVLDSLSGEGITAAQQVTHRSVSEFTSSIFDQTTFYGAGFGAANSITLTNAPAGFLALAPSQGGTSPIRELADLPSRAVQPVAPYLPPRSWRAWATGFGGAEDLHGSTGLGTAAQNDTIYGGSLGVDYQILPNYIAGIAIGGTSGDFNVGGRATSGSTTGGHVAFYDLAEFGPFYGASSNSFSYFTNHETRSVTSFGAIGGETDHGTFDSHEFRTRLEFGRHVDGLGFGGLLTPFVALELAELRSNGFNETNLAGPTVLGLNVQGQDTASVPSFVGARYQAVTRIGNGMILSPSLQVAYVHEFAPERNEIAGLINLPAATFLVDGARPSRDAAQVKAGAELVIGSQTSIFATFDGEFSGQAQFYGGKGGLKYVF